MKIQQEILPYRPITIKLEKEFEAIAFFDLIDKLEAFRVNEGGEVAFNSFSRDEINLIIELSNARTENIVRM